MPAGDIVQEFITDFNAALAAQTAFQLWFTLNVLP
jgi:hypothetical protein